MTDPETAKRTTELANYVNLLPQFAIRAMATLDLPGLIAHGTHEVQHLAEKTGTRPEILGRLLQYLADRSLLVQTGPDTYDLAPHSRVLAEDSDFRNQIAAGGPMHKMEQAYAGLLDTIRTGQAAYPAIHGRPLYDDFDADADLTAASATALSSRATRAANEISTSYPWDQVESIVDVGGGDGAVLTVLLSTHPHLSGTIIDLPQSVSLAERAIKTAELSDRLTAASGSFFDPLPRESDLYLLASILIDWPDDKAVAILRRCREACNPDGQVLIADWFRTPESNAALMSHIDLHQLTLVGGRVRTIDEVSALAARADLTMESTLSFDSGMTMAVLRP